jgi:hypothetical protein
MVKANGLVILTEEEDDNRIKKIIHETLQAYSSNNIKEDKIIDIDELRLMFGAKKVGDKVIGFPTARTINDWIRRKEKPLPCISRNPSKFLASAVFNWLVNDKDSYQH